MEERSGLHQDQENVGLHAHNGWVEWHYTSGQDCFKSLTCKGNLKNMDELKKKAHLEAQLRGVFKLIGHSTQNNCILLISSIIHMIIVCVHVQLLCLKGPSIKCALTPLLYLLVFCSVELYGSL